MSGGVRRLAVMAHYDPAGEVAPHVRRQVQALTADFDVVVVVTTADLTDAARGWLRDSAQLIERANEGYDFMSYKVGLGSVDLAAFDEVAICNDSYVGPLKPYRDIIAAMDTVEADFWGLTGSDQIAPHLQSFFIVFRRTALASDVFGRFWADLEPISERFKVVRRYEVGLSKKLHAAGLRSATYFRPSEDEARRARRRVHWEALHKHRLPLTPSAAKDFRKRWTRPSNPCIANADSVLDGARLPIVKIETLRFDPYRLNARSLLAACERAYPAEFAGVRDYLQRTAERYPTRASDLQGETPAHLRPFRRLVAYRSV